jgi:hypothetical protein
MVRKSGRREFARQIAAAGAAVVIGGTSAPAAEISDAGEIESRHQRIIQKYGDRLTPEQKSRLRKILVFNEKMMEPIRNFPLENGQPTASALKFYPELDARKK